MEIALSPGDPRRVMPQIPGTCHSVLDIGCGAGQTLAAANLALEVLAVGVELDPDAIEVGKELAPAVQFICASGDSLPFQSKSFDFVFSRVALPYMNIPVALGEMARVLTPGGGLWLLLHPTKMAFEDLANALRSLNPKASLFRFYVVLNGLFFHFTGETIRWPFSGRGHESFQTDRGIHKALQARGFVNIKIQDGEHFIVTAQKVATGSTG
jgi:SAM-dependent methyltransferase